MECWFRTEEGIAAGQDCQPRAMKITDSFTGQTWVDESGMCGFAWVVFKGNTSFGRWALKNKLARKAYSGGLHLWVSAYEQSYDRKSAYAAAFAEVLRKHGIDAYADNRLD